jgi:peptide deformylase
MAMNDEDIKQELPIALVHNGYPLLKEVMPPCTLDKDEREDLAAKLLQSMQYNMGVGLSANQVGIKERVFIFYDDVTTKSLEFCFNPEIVKVGEDEIFMDEGCLTYPGLWVKVKRPEMVVVKFQGTDPDSVEERVYHGLTARIWQHEFDHMEGTNFTKRVSKLRLDRAKKRVLKQRKKADRIEK